MLKARGDVGDSAKVNELLDLAQLEANAIGMQSVTDKIVQCRIQWCRDSGSLRFPAGLSKREAQVLQLVAVGRENRDIARELFVSSNTVANHIQSILRKTRSANRTEAAAFAMQNGLLNVFDTMSKNPEPSSYPAE